LTALTEGIVIHNLYDYIYYYITSSLNELNIYNTNDLLVCVLKFKFYLFNECLNNTPKFQEQDNSQTILDENIDTVGSNFIFPIKKSDDYKFSLGNVLMPQCNNSSEFVNNNYVDNFSNSGTFLQNSYELNPVYEYYSSSSIKNINPYFKI
jgi:hypothetical protein